MKPKEYRQGGVGNSIRFAIAQGSLGAILIASSDKGVCAISMGDDPDALARNLQDQFPKANLVGGDESYEKVVAKVVGFVESPKNRTELALGRSRNRLPTAGVEGTAANFQWGRRPAIPKWQNGSVSRKRCEPSRRRVARMCLP
jgi:hypothetical protein